ncbi:hypothetical protein ACEWY4_001913 [Coilia grayii]|uniref:EF-hand domain-containing protein n=1 Tax=Coilia grayii TaxID=363190 RepID=A0ABD1KU97_9TELE
MERYLSPGNDGAGLSLPLSSLRLLVPPLRVMTAFMSQVVQQKKVMHYDKLDEFVTMVTELAPQLLSHREKIQLLLGLRAKFLLELCRGPVDGPTVQHYLDRMKTCCVSSSLSEMKESDIEVSMSNFENVIYALLKDPVEKAYFFQEIYPVEYGPKYDTAVKDLMSELLSRLEQWMPVPDMEQAVSWLTAVPAFFEKCLQLGTKDLKFLLQHSPSHRHWSPVTSTCSNEDSNSILNSLASPLPAIKVVVATEPVTYHIQSDATCVGILNPGSLADVVAETIIVTEYTEVELRTSDEVGVMPTEEAQANILPLVNEEIEVKMETSHTVEETPVLVEESGHVSEEMVTVLEEPLHLAESVNCEMKDAVGTVAKDAVGSQSVADGKLAQSETVVLQGNVAPQGVGACGVMDVDIKRNTLGTGESNDPANENMATTDKDKNSVGNSVLIKCGQQDSKAAPTVSTPEDGASQSKREDSSAVESFAGDLSDLVIIEVAKAPQTVTPRRGPGRPRKSEQKNSNTPVSTPRRRGRRPNVKKEEEDVAVVIPLCSGKENGKQELNVSSEPDGKEGTADQPVEAAESKQNKADVPKASAGPYRTRTRRSSSSSISSSLASSKASSDKSSHYRFTCDTCGRTFTRSSDVQRKASSARPMVAFPMPTARPNQVLQTKSGPCPKAGTVQKRTGQEKSRSQTLANRSSISAEEFKALILCLLPSLSSFQYNALSAKVMSKEDCLSTDYQNFSRGRPSDTLRHSQREGTWSRCSSVAEQPPALYKSFSKASNIRVAEDSAAGICDDVSVVWMQGKQRCVEKLAQVRCAALTSGVPCVKRVIASPVGQKACFDTLTPKNTMSSNLKGVMRALRLYDYNRDGQIQRHELRRLLDKYLPMSNTEFKRLWFHYNPNRFAMMPYKELLTNLGVNSEKYAKFMRQSYNEVWRALQVFDVTCSGVLHLEDLHSITNNFLFPMSLCTFHSLLRRSNGGIRTAAAVAAALGNEAQLQVEELLRHKLSRSHAAVSQALCQLDWKGRGTVGQEELRKVIQKYSLPLTDQHFHRSLEVASGSQMKEADDLLWRLRERLSLRSLALGDCFLPPTATGGLGGTLSVSAFRKNLYSAFRLMDKDRDGFVYPCDYLVLHTSLGFVCKDSEYSRLLRWLFFSPSKNITYREFQKIVQSKGLKLRVQPASGAPSFSVLQRLSRYGKDGVQIILKNDFKNLALSFGLPITPDELQMLWSRYDPDGKGYLTASEFRERLKLDPTEDICRPVTVVSLPSANPRPKSGVSLKDIGDLVRQHYHDLSADLSRVEQEREREREREKGRPGTEREEDLSHVEREWKGEGENGGAGRVRVEDLQDVLKRHGCSLGREQLHRLLHSLKVRVVDGGLAWQQFLRAFEPSPEQPSQVSHLSSAPSLAPTQDLQALSPGRAILRLRELVTASAHTLQKVFSSFDRNDSGTVSSLLFRRVLDHFCARLSDLQYRCLLSHLALDWDSNAVCWRSFLEQFDANSKESKAPTPAPLQPLSNGELLSCVRGVISEHLFSITMEMLDMDSANCGTISKEDFREVADHHFHFLSPEQLDWLWEQLPVTERGDLDYRAFLKRFSSDEPCVSPSPASPALPCPSPLEAETPPVTRRPMSAPCSSRTGKQGQRRGACSGPLLLNCEAVERRIQSRVHCCWREIHRRCRQEDQRRSGQISQHAFMAILKELHVDLEDQELKQLAKKYDIQSNGQLSYPDFLHHFVFFLHPQTKQAFELQPKRSDTLHKQTLALEDDLCALAVLRMSKLVRQRWRSMRQSFAAHDHNHSGSVPIPEFRRVLRQHSVNLSEDEFFHLVSCFDKDAGGRISYNHFLRTLLR